MNDAMNTTLDSIPHIQAYSRKRAHSPFRHVYFVDPYDASLGQGMLMSYDHLYESGWEIWLDKSNEPKGPDFGDKNDPESIAWAIAHDIGFKG